MKPRRKKQRRQKASDQAENGDDTGPEVTVQGNSAGSFVLTPSVIGLRLVPGPLFHGNVMTPTTAPVTVWIVRNDEGGDAPISTNVEAKKCGVNISADPAPAYQLRRYGFSAKLALSILTDFEELGVYDCASRPSPTDKASHARIQYFGFTEYPDRWREIWDVFSREAVWSGAFDQYAASKRKRGTSEVDSEFLKDIEGWRDVLARNLALRNGMLTADDLNASVQQIIDRLIFLRMAEDRGLESYGQLLKLCERPGIYTRFVSDVCRRADEKYNSGLFHFQKESGISDPPDTLTPSLIVDDNALKPILQSLYFEHGCPYHFGVLPVEILGTVYERFLGKVIRLTAGHQAKVEEKPEVRKAGGVYYTPAYIVNYIVQNTIGKQIEGRSPDELAGGKTTGNYDIYVNFIERGLNLLSPAGHLGMILPNKFLRTDYGRGLRSVLCERQSVEGIVDFGAEQVFDATTYTCLLFLSHNKNSVFEYSISKAGENFLRELELEERQTDSLTCDTWTLANQSQTELMVKLKSRSTRLLDLPADMSRGSSSGDDETFVIDAHNHDIENEILRTPLFASDFGRHFLCQRYLENYFSLCCRKRKTSP